MSDDRWCRQIRMHCVTVNLESRFLNGVTIALTNLDAAIGLVSTKLVLFFTCFVCEFRHLKASSPFHLPEAVISINQSINISCHQGSSIDNNRENKYTQSTIMFKAFDNRVPKKLLERCCNEGGR